MAVNIKYMGNENLKKVGVPIEYTEEQVIEIKKCAIDPIYFIDNYCYIVTIDHGIQLLKLWDFQKDYIHAIHNNRMLIVMLSRQMSKTTVAAAYILWYTIFQSNKTVAIVANKEENAKETLSRYQLMYEHLPIWMQQGVKTWNKGDIELENGSKIRASATSAGGLRSKSCITGDSKICVCDNDDIYYTEIENVLNNNIKNDIDTTKQYVIYKTTNIKNNNIYIDLHTIDKLGIKTEYFGKGSIFKDGYIGSGKLIKIDIEKYGPESFNQEILKIFYNKKEAEEYKKTIVNKESTSDEISYNLSKLKVLSTDGFVEFESILDQGIRSTLKITFNDKSYIICTPDHKFLIENSYWELAENLKVFDILSDKMIVDIEEYSDMQVYDLFNVGTCHNYYANGVINHNCSFLYVDEASIISNTIAEQFFAATYPVISSGKTSKIVMTSTPLGYNHFWKYWNDAKTGQNDFHAFHVPYWKVPGRDKKWADEQLRLLGEVKFNQEILCLGGEATITLRDKETNEIFEITLEEAYNLL